MTARQARAPGSVCLRLLAAAQEVIMLTPRGQDFPSRGLTESLTEAAAQDQREGSSPVDLAEGPLGTSHTTGSCAVSLLKGTWRALGEVWALPLPERLYKAVGAKVLLRGMSIKWGCRILYLLGEISLFISQVSIHICVCLCVCIYTHRHMVTVCIYYSPYKQHWKLRD